MALIDFQISGSLEEAAELGEAGRGCPLGNKGDAAVLLDDDRREQQWVGQFGQLP